MDLDKDRMRGGGQRRLRSVSKQPSLISPTVNWVPFEVNDTVTRASGYR